MDGREATIGILKGAHIQVLRRLNSTAHAKVRKGGQSAQRYQRAIEESIGDYVKRISESINEIFVNNQFKINGGGSSQDGNILILNTSTNELTGGIDSSSFFYPSAVTFSNNKLYTLESPNKLLILNATTGALITSVTGIFNSPSHLITSGSNLYVTNSGSNNVIIINTINNQVTNSISENYLNSPTGITVI